MKVEERDLKEAIHCLGNISLARVSIELNCKQLVDDILIKIGLYMSQSEEGDIPKP